LTSGAALCPFFLESFRLVEEDTFYSILPTATHYARNAIFSGMLPIDIEKKYRSNGKTMMKKAARTCLKKSFSGRS
jgi:hypothetical protein